MDTFDYIRQRRMQMQANIMKGFNPELGEAIDENFMFAKGELEIDEFEKAVYADTPQNRKLGRVGQEYKRGKGQVTTTKDSTHYRRDEKGNWRVDTAKRLKQPDEKETKVGKSEKIDLSSKLNRKQVDELLDKLKKMKNGSRITLLGHDVYNTYMMKKVGNSWLEVPASGENDAKAIECLENHHLKTTEGMGEMTIKNMKQFINNYNGSKNTSLHLSDNSIHEDNAKAPDKDKLQNAKEGSSISIWVGKKKFIYDKNSDGTWTEHERKGGLAWDGGEFKTKPTGKKISTDKLHDKINEGWERTQIDTSHLSF